MTPAKAEFKGFSLTIAAPMTCTPTCFQFSVPGPLPVSPLIGLLFSAPESFSTLEASCTQSIALSLRRLLEPLVAFSIMVKPTVTVALYWFAYVAAYPVKPPLLLSPLSAPAPMAAPANPAQLVILPSVAN